jgi:hypothetical protein
MSLAQYWTGQRWHQVCFVFNIDIKGKGVIIHTDIITRGCVLDHMLISHNLGSNDVLLDTAHCLLY